MLKAIAASAMLAIACVAHMDLCKLACHTVAVKFALGHAARNAAVDIVFHVLLLITQYPPLM